MNNLISNIGIMVEQCSTLSKIRINLTTYVEMMKTREYQCFVDPQWKTAVLQAGHYCDIFGVQIHVNKVVPDDAFQISIDDAWSIPIKLSDTHKLNRLINLKILW